MPQLDNLETASASDLAAAVAVGQVSALELVDAAIDRIETRDRPINAVVVRDFDRAREAAKTADSLPVGSPRAPLHGVPMTVKESHNVAGLKTTWGFEGFKDFIVLEDSVGVARLKAAGAIILGKTNVPPFLGDWQSANPIYGRTNNPWNLARSPGGSSGGAAAALASGMVPLEFGSDIGGSIRIPAVLCGVYGHKPSYNLIPMKGHSPPGAVGAGLPLAVVGPMARTAADLDLALSVLAGPFGGEAKGYRLDLPGPRHAQLADYRVLIIDAYPGVALDEEVRAALLGLADQIAAAGAIVSRHSDLMPVLTEAGELYQKMLGTAMSRGGPPQPNPISAHDWMGMLDEQHRLRLTWAKLFETFDIVLAPAFGTVAFPHNPGPEPRTLNINGEETPYFGQMAWPGLATLSNLPATAIPIGQSKAGLPIGIQVIGAYLEDRTTIGFAGLLEHAFGGFRAPK